MAAIFWASNQRAGLIPEEELEQVSAALLKSGVTALQIQKLKEYYCTRIFTMVAALDKARLRVATTACTYFYRFFSKYTFQDHDPRLIVPACIYLSVKVNENNIQKSKFYTAFAINHDQSLVGTFTTKMLLDNEVLLLQALDCNLLTFSAHSDLPPILHDMKKHKTMRKAVFEDNLDSNHKPLLAQHAWSAVCDAYCCGAGNVEPPCTIAIACVVLAANFLKIDCTAWLVCVDHDGEGVMRVVTRMAEMHARTTLGSEEALKLLQRLGVQVKLSSFGQAEGGDEQAS